jgi:hypothetical protein
VCLAGLALTDKIAFAARFLSDRQLADYLEREWLTLLAAGSIQVSSHKNHESTGTGTTNNNKIVKDKKFHFKNQCWGFVRDILMRIRIPDLTPDPIPFFSDFKEPKQNFYFTFFLLTYPQAQNLQY